MLRTNMKKFKIITLPGDGIGPEITSSAVNILNAISDLNDIEFEIVEKYLKPIYKDFKIPDGGFFLWLKVNDDKKASKILWEKFSLRVMPGSFMAKDINGFNPGRGFLRISLVDKKEVIEETMRRICLFLKTDIAQGLGFLNE